MWDFIKLLFYFLAPYLVFAMISTMGEGAIYFMVFYAIVFVLWLLLRPINKK